MAYGGSNNDVIDDVTWSWKVKVVIPISLRSVISKMARDRDSVLTGQHLPPQPYIKAVKKFTWWIYALSERLLVVSAFYFSCIYTRTSDVAQAGVWEVRTHTEDGVAYDKYWAQNFLARRVLFITNHRQDNSSTGNGTWLMRPRWNNSSAAAVIAWRKHTYAYRYMVSGVLVH